MSEKVKAAISYLLSAACYVAFAVDTLVVTDLSNGISLAVVVVGAIASALGIFWTAPNRNAAARRIEDAD
jgi:hypothetical protein